MNPDKKLRRPQNGKIIGGVCAAFADYFDLDVSLVRIAYVAISLMTILPGALLYIIAWFVIPKDENYY